MSRKVNFNLVESHCNDSYEIYEPIKKDILDGMKVKDIKEKYNLSDGEWIKFRRELKEEGIRNPSRRKNKGNGKYYYWHKTKERYFVQRRINGKVTFFGMLRTKSECEKFIGKLNKYGWRKSNIPQIKREMGL